MLSRNLEKSLHRALAHANERRHEYATLEHLLLALTEDQDLHLQHHQSLSGHQCLLLPLPTPQ